MNIQTLEIIKDVIKISSFGEKNNTLLIDDKVFAYNSQQICLDLVTAIKFGEEIIQFDMFPIGRKYQLSLKTEASQLDIIFKTYFKISSNYFDILFDKILNNVWLKVSPRLFNNSLKFILTGSILEIGNCRINKTGITLLHDNGLFKKPFLICWDDLIYEKKFNRLVLNSKSKTENWTNLYYLENWNVDILMDILDWIYGQGGLTVLQSGNISQT